MIAKNVEAKNIKIIRDMIKSDIKHQGSVTALLDKKSKVKWKITKNLNAKKLTNLERKRHLQFSIDELLKDVDDMAL